jgi:hypothetical protein
VNRRKNGIRAEGSNGKKIKNQIAKIKNVEPLRGGYVNW